jgi:hypothetical protein
MSLQDEFNQLVGLTIKDPYRVTTDMDPESEKIKQLAEKHSLHLNWVKAGESDDDMFMCDVQAAHVYITKEGVPADKQPWGWRVLAINVD